MNRKTEPESRFSVHPPETGDWREQWYYVIFEAETKAGKLFDMGLLVAILINLFAICMETVSPWNKTHAWLWLAIEWTCTFLFTLEYFARIACVKQPLKYIFSFYGLIDLLSIVPAYASQLFPAAQSFAVLRSFRLLRIFRVMKMHWLTTESESLWQAVWQARAKIVVFVSVVLVAVTIAGTLMYEIEGRHINSDLESTGQFDSIPSSIYWAIVTMTTVGYGDIVPKTAAGKAVSSVLILLGYSLIIVPTGFVSSEFAKDGNKSDDLQCDLCSSIKHDSDAKFCKSCGQRLSKITVGLD